MKTFQAAALSAFCAFALIGCGKISLPFSKKSTPTPAPAPAAAAATPAPASPATAPKTAESKVAPAEKPDAAPAADEPVVVDTSAEVVVLCYHRLEGKAGGVLSIEPELFEKHMQEIKDKGLAVISMQDFLDWREGKKSIPPKSVIITIDDGYVSGLDVGVPILKKFGYPATFYVYLDYINKGGKSVTWDQLGKLRDDGFDIGSHTISHQDLRVKPKKSKAASYEEWLKEELERSKQEIESQLGIRVLSIAYPFGNHNPKVHAAAQAAGYDLGFTTYGQRIGHAASPFAIGRYDVTAKDAQGHDGFHLAVGFEGGLAASGTMAQEASALMVTIPAKNAVVNDQKPAIRANLSSLGALDPASVIMRISGLGIVPAEYDAESKNISYTPTDPLRPGNVTVIITGKAGSQSVETKWAFKVDPNAKATGGAEEAVELPPRR